MAAKLDKTSVVTEYVLPNAPEVLGVINDHVVRNFLRGGVSDMQLLSARRLAKLVVTEETPLILSRYKYKP
jgi:hypothetical protein